MKPDPIKFEGRAHLESRIRQQRHEITVCQAALRERNVRLRSWYEGREAILREQLREANAAMNGWRQEAERHKARYEALSRP